MGLWSGVHELLDEAATEEPSAAKSGKNLGYRTYPQN